MSTIPLTYVHPSLHNHPLLDDLYPVMGDKKFEMLMEMWAAIYDDKYGEWRAKYADAPDYIDACDELDEWAHDYIEMICEDEDEEYVQQLSREADIELSKLVITSH